MWSYFIITRTSVVMVRPIVQVPFGIALQLRIPRVLDSHFRFRSKFLPDILQKLKSGLKSFYGCQ